MARSREEARAAVLENSIPVPESGCWLYLGSVKEDGYGQPIWYGDNGTRDTPHRIVARAGKDDLACHHCDVPSCVNPAHLYVGTYKTNADDKVKRNRIPNHYKIAKKELDIILNSELPSTTLAKKLTVSASTIRRIRLSYGQERPRQQPTEISKEILETILASPLTASQLEPKVGLSATSINKIRKAHEKSRKVPPISEEEVKLILDSPLPGLRLAKIIGRSVSVISKIRRQHGQKRK